MFGESLVRGEKCDFLAEGYYTVWALNELADKYGVELPICRSVYGVLYENADINNGFAALFHRSLKEEF